ncbi:MAG TPA: hypothetical protein VJ951_04295, partial [Bacteroidales bacterium]|nr:hypothetical protein [Bacteroidales bacterium]
MRNLTLVVVILFLFSCVPQSNEKLYNNVQAGFEDLISDLSEDYPRNLLPQDWFEYYQDIIHQKNPNFTTNTIEGLKYLLVPYLMVNGDSIETDDIDILSLISNGTMSVDECWVMIFEDNQHIGR